MPGPDGDDALRDLIDEERRAAARAGRRRRHWLDQQARAATTLAGVLVDVADRGDPVSISTLAGTSVRGPVEHVAADAVVVRGTDPTATRHLVALAHVAQIRTAGDPTSAVPTAVDPVGDRPRPSGPSLAEVLRAIAEEDGRAATVVVALADASTAHGRLWLLGEDVAGVRGDDGRSTYVPLAAIAQLSW